MFYPIIRAVCLGWLIGGSVMSGVVQAATEILSLNPASLREMTLESIPPWPDDMVLSGTNEHWQKILHEGEFVIALYEAMPATIDVAVPYTYDEYVLVLEGSVVLTSTEGVRQAYQTGDQFLVPQGWTGTWEMPSRFRELIIVETEQWEASDSLLVPQKRFRCWLIHSSKLSWTVFHLGLKVSCSQVPMPTGKKYCMKGSWSQFCMALRPRFWRSGHRFPTTNMFSLSRDK
jgi:uncharacterized cupin superfamily protein